MPDHATIERRSLAYHRLVAERLDAAMVARAQARLDRWERAGRLPPVAGARWRALLAGPSAALLAALRSDDEPYRALRQSTPFAGELSDRERWRLIREVR